MSDCSVLRGHPIYEDEAGVWRFCDDNSPTATGWADRPCARCGLHGNSKTGEPDPCLGELAGVVNACCGHGNPDEAYIVFVGGLVIRGFDIDQLHQRAFAQEEQQLIEDHNRARQPVRKL